MDTNSIEKHMYNVVFKNITNGPHKGLITWTDYITRDAFLADYTGKIREERVVMSQGIPTSKCVEIAKTTPLSTLLLVCIDRATDPSKKIINEIILAQQIANLRVYGII